MKLSNRIPTMMDKYYIVDTTGWKFIGSNMWSKDGEYRIKVKTDA